MEKGNRRQNNVRFSKIKTMIIGPLMRRNRNVLNLLISLFWTIGMNDIIICEQGIKYPLFTNYYFFFGRVDKIYFIYYLKI